MKFLKRSIFVLFGLLLSASVFAGTHTMTGNQTITQIAAANPNFSTLVTALKAADLAQVLNSPGQYTVFAPTNAAFAKLPAGTLQNLLKPQNKQQLTDILLYHVVKGKVMAADVRPGKVKTMEGQKIRISKKRGKLMINRSAQITSTDIVASNGVIHVINAVLMPPKH